MAGAAAPTDKARSTRSARARVRRSLRLRARPVTRAALRPAALAAADTDTVDRAADQIERELGPIDVWLNVAMTTVYVPFTEIMPAEYKRSTEVTYPRLRYLLLAPLRWLCSS
jgi:NAD(P)-dependent dehydrogenase (short-subunit alcohol dehydrogenase family)